MTKQKFSSYVTAMVDSLLEYAESCNIDLSDFVYDYNNWGAWQDYLDDKFNDGGYARCEKFTDIGLEYSCSFGSLESKTQDAVQFVLIRTALKELRKRIFYKNHKV